MQQDVISKYRVLIIGLLIFAFVVVPIIYYIYSSVSRGNKTEVILLSMPTDAVITFNNTNVKPGTLFLEPGAYTVKAQKDGFVPYEMKTEIGKEKKTIVVALEASSEEAKKWIEQNKEKYLEFEGKAGKAASEEGASFQDKNPIVKALPYGTYLYQIGYQNDPSDSSGNSVIVTIDAPSGYRAAAIAKIRELGADPAQLKIMFRNYESPFSHE